MSWEEPGNGFAGRENRNHVSENVVDPVFGNAVQQYSAASRLVFYKDVKAPLIERIPARLHGFKVGDLLDLADYIGALTDAGHCKKMRSYLNFYEKGPYVTQRILKVSKDDPAGREEIFGLALYEIEVISSRMADRAARDVWAGMVAVSCYVEGNMLTLFGEHKAVWVWWAQQKFARP
ncbi:MAG: aldehyde dehydrogenase family protein [Roseobacter sp.]